MSTIKYIGLAIGMLIFSHLAYAQAPEIIQHPPGMNKCLGDEASLIVVATGAEPLVYQWYKNGVPTGDNSSVLHFAALALSDAGEYYCNVSNAEGDQDCYPTNVTITPEAPEIISISTQNDLVCLNTSNQISVTHNGQYSTVTWYFNDDLIANGGTYTISSASLANEGDYYCIVQNACGSDISDIIPINIVIPANIVTQPQTQTICEGDDLEFTTVSEGDYLFYIWMKNDEILVSEQTPNLSLYDVAYPHTDYYNLIAYNVCNHDTSNTVYVVVNNIPQVFGHPINHSLCLGEEVDLYAFAGGTTEANYQWHNLESGIIADADGTSIAVELMPNDTAYYYCVISNNCGIVSTDTAQIITKMPPEITQQPEGDEVCAGDNVAMQVKVIGTEPFYYQWLFNGTDVYGSNILGDELETIYINEILQGQDGIYSCHISNQCGFVISDDVQVIVNVPPVVTENANDIDVCEGEEILIDISSSGTEPVQYEWYILENDDVLGTDQDFYIDYATVENTGQYYNILSNMCGTVSSDTVLVEIRELVSIINNPVGGEVCVGDYVEMEVVATGDEPLEYLWYRNGSAVSSQTNAILSYDEAQVNQTGEYFCRVFNSCGYEDSEPTMLIVGSPPAITWNPAPQYLCELDTLNLIMDVAGDNYTIQWYFNDSPIVGQNDTVLNYSMVNISHEGNYYCLAYNSCAVVSTDTVFVEINQAPEIELGDDIDLCTGEIITIGTDNEYVHYNWNNGLSFQPYLEVQLGGTFILEVTGENSCKNRDTIIVTYHPYHQILFDSEPIIGCGAYELNAGANAYSYSWNTGHDGQFLMVTSPGTYSVTTTGDSFGCETSVSVFVDIREPISFSLGDDVVAPVDTYVNIGIDPIFSEYYWNTGFTGPLLTVYGSSYGVGIHTFWLTAVALNGCNHTDTIKVEFYNNANINTSGNKKEIEIYPNPTNSYVFVEAKDFVIDYYELFSIDGQLIVKEIIKNDKLTLNLSNFAKGIYLLKLTDSENKVQFKKILVN